MKVIIDRIEGDFAVVESGDKMYNIPCALLPDAKEGDTVEINVLGRQDKEEEPHAIFEKLRRKSRKNKPAEKQDKSTAEHEGADASSDGENVDKTADSQG